MGQLAFARRKSQRRDEAAITEVRFEPSRCLSLRAAEQSHREVDHVPVRSAAEAVEVIAVQLQARRPVRVERTAHEAMLHRHVTLRRLDGRYAVFDFVVVDSFSTSLEYLREKAPSYTVTFFGEMRNLHSDNSQKVYYLNPNLLSSLCRYIKRAPALRQTLTSSG